MEGNIYKFDLIYDIVYFIIIAIFIMLLSYLATKLLSTKINTLTRNRNIKIIEKVTLGIDKSLILVKIDSYYYLIGITKNKIQLLDKMESLTLKDNNSIDNYVKKNTFKDMFNLLKKDNFLER